jgi:hypothetical protein
MSINTPYTQDTQALNGEAEREGSEGKTTLDEDGFEAA